MTIKVEHLLTPDGPPPGGHYTHAVAFGDLVFISGQLPVANDGTHQPHRNFDDQARQALANLWAVMAGFGGGPEHLLRVTVYIVGVEHWPAFNRIYAEACGDAKPARAVVPVPNLHHGYLVEIDAVAARPGV